MVLPELHGEARRGEAGVNANRNFRRRADAMREAGELVGADQRRFEHGRSRAPHAKAGRTGGAGDRVQRRVWKRRNPETRRGLPGAVRVHTRDLR